MILLDWDDTVLPSTVLTLHGVEADRLEIPGGLKRALGVLEKSVHKFLVYGVEYGQIIVVTNSDVGWVELSGKRFMPQIYHLMQEREIKVGIAYRPHLLYTYLTVRLLSRLCHSQVVYAKSLYRSIASTLAECKAIAFREQVELLYPGAEEVNVIAIGDSKVEVDAAHDLAQGMPTGCVKVVRFPANPTLEILNSQFSVLRKRFDDIWKGENSTEIRLM